MSEPRRPELWGGRMLTDDEQEQADAYMDELEAEVKRLLAVFDGVLTYCADDTEFCDNLQKDIHTGEPQTCVWRYDSAELERGEATEWCTSCGGGYMNTINDAWEISYGAVSDFKVCPYCGKPIEIKEDTP